MTVNDSAIAGAISAISARVVSTPLDVIKIRFQLQVEPIRTKNYASKYRGVFQTIQSIIAEEGKSGLYKGMTPGLLLYVLYGSVQFSFYDKTKTILKEQFKMNNKVVRDFIGGCLGGGIASVVCYPLDILRTRLTGQGEPKLYKNISKAIVLMYRESGLRTFYKGLMPALLLIVPRTGFSFGFYSIYTLLWRHWVAADTKVALEGKKEIDSLICGALAGATSKTLTMPIDTVKMRLQVQGFDEARKPFGRVVQYSGVLNAFKTIWKDEKIYGFFKGSLPGVIKTSLTTAISFYTYEYVIQVLRQT